MKDPTILIQGPYFEFNEYNSNRNINILKKFSKRKNINFNLKTNKLDIDDK